MTAIVSAEIDSTPIDERFILAQVDRVTLVFPASWVVEILRLNRAHILDLPFYDPMLLGVIHHNGNVLPLVSAYRLFDLSQLALREILTVVRLDRAAGNLANVGLVVDRAIGSKNRRDLPASLFDAGATTSSASIQGKMVLCQAELFPSHLWHPH
jgi:chemotaxis signal transduction protein